MIMLTVHRRMKKMKKNNFYIILAIIIFATSSHPQGFWDLSPGPNDHASTHNDTTALGIKSIIHHDPMDAYWGPLRLLAYYHGDTERSFILDSMRLYAYQDTLFDLMRYYNYQYVRGYLGDPGVFLGLDTCATMMGMGYKCLKAIRLLAENGFYNHFDKVQSALLQKGLTYDAIYCLEAYSKSLQYRDQCKNLLASIINDPNQNGGEVSIAAEKLAALDKAYASSLLLSRFSSSDFIKRLTIFDYVNHINPDLKVEMSKMGLTTESLDNTSYFIPRYYTGIVKDPTDGSGFVAGDSKKFVKPDYIKFIKDFKNQQPPQDAKWVIGRFLRDFRPIPETTTVLIMLDTLISTKQQVTNYNWLGDNSFVTELDNHLTSARNFLVSGDSLSCAYQIFTFQKKVDEEYRDSLDGDGKFITREGWKFLYYNAEYLLERLPDKITLPSSISNGWNMISVPVDVTYYTKSVLYPNSTSNAFAYQSGTGYVAKDTLSKGVGYWLKFGTIDTVKYKGFIIGKDSIPVKTGWNMIGSISALLPTGKITSSPSGVVTSNYFGYTGSTGYFVSNSIEPGRAYWVKVGTDCKLILDTASSSSSGQTPSEEPPPAPGSPSTPILYSPSNGTTGVPRTPTLSWFAAERATTYRLQVSLFSDFRSFVLNDSTITTTSKSIGTLAHSTTYYWRVKAKNESGTSYWSDMWWFQVIGSHIDPCPPINDFSVMDRLTVSDAGGSSQKLFAYNGGRKLSMKLKDFDMPPEPIGEVFHSRFKSDKLVESIPPGIDRKQIHIKVKNARYPLTLGWEIRPENRTRYWLKKSDGQEVELIGSGSIEINSLNADAIQIESLAIQPPCVEF
jgi:hypothetical protein